MASRHRLLNKDIETKTATCSVCGPGTKIYDLDKRKGTHVCSNKANERAKNRRAKPGYQYPKRDRPRNLSKYGIDETDLEIMLLRQKDVCAICSGTDETRKLSIDHDHRCCPGKMSCGKCVRGLLCSRCNMALGLANDDPRRLRAMAAYLDEFS